MLFFKNSVWNKKSYRQFTTKHLQIYLTQITWYTNIFWGLRRAHTQIITKKEMSAPKYQIKFTSPLPIPTIIRHSSMKTKLLRRLPHVCWLFILSTVLVLVFVVYNRRREAHIKYPGPDDDVRENIINYDDEGGGEDDMTAFDITPLQIPIGGPIPELAPPKIGCKCFLDRLYLTTLRCTYLIIW